MSSPGRGWGRLRIGALALGFAVFGALALRAAVLAGPAFDGDLRVEAPGGDWRVSEGSAHFRQPVYLRIQALDWLEAAGATRDEGAARTARDLLRRSLALAPANAFAWTQLAWAEVALSDAAAARAALEASWRTAPYSADLSVGRLLIASALALQEDEAAHPAIMRDLAVARRMERAAFAAVLAMRPRLKPLADALDAAPQEAR